MTATQGEMTGLISHISHPVGGAALRPTTSISGWCAPYERTMDRARRAVMTEHGEGTEHVLGGLPPGAVLTWGCASPYSTAAKDGPSHLSRGESANGDRTPPWRDEQRLAELGYKQELRRGWSGFSNFAISFSIICVLAGCFTTYGQAFNNGGPVDISIGWPVISI
jgi:hypothetical protein